MKTTATISEIITSEWKKSGQDEIMKDDRFVKFGSDDVLSFKILEYKDENLKSVIDHAIFGNFKYNDNDVDNFVKKTFINQFWYREIGFQTLDLFRQKLLAELFKSEKYISTLYTDYNDYLSGHNTTSQDTNGSSTNKNTNQNDNRQGYIDLPQDTVNYDVDNTILPYATNATYSRVKDNVEGSATNSNNTNTSSNSKNATVFKEMESLLDDFFIKLDKKLFLHVW